MSKDPIEELGGMNLYGYVRGNPVSSVDPSGLLNLAASVGGSLVTGAGAEGSLGIYITLPSYGQNFDIGVYGEGGFDAGGNIGGGFQVGVIKGNESDIQGISYNLNAGGTIGSGIVMFDENGKLAGVAAGPAADFGLSVSYAKTGAFGLNDFGSALGIWLYEKLHSDNMCK